jgi:hypothetical protein
MLNNIKQGDVVKLRCGAKLIVRGVKQSGHGIDLKFEGYNNSLDWHGSLCGRHGTLGTESYNDIVRVEDV